MNSPSLDLDTLQDDSGSAGTPYCFEVLNRVQDDGGGDLGFGLNWLLVGDQRTFATPPEVPRLRWLRSGNGVFRCWLGVTDPDFHQDDGWSGWRGWL